MWLWLVALAVSPSEVVNGAPVPSRNSPADIRVPGGKGGEPPHLVFASDRPTGELESMLAEPGVVADLIDLKAGIALALPNLTVDAANLVRKLNRDGILVTAWLTVPADQGYYLNASNGRQAKLRFEEFEKWTTTNELRWAALGLDIEGCVRQGFLARLKSVNWNESVTISAESVRRATQFRARVQKVLWIVSNLPYLLAVILIAFAWTWRNKRRLRGNSHLKGAAA